jgi:DNA-binding NarL/FixJ family response regulator
VGSGTILIVVADDARRLALARALQSDSRPLVAVDTMAAGEETASTAVPPVDLLVTDDALRWGDGSRLARTVARRDSSALALSLSRPLGFGGVLRTFFLGSVEADVVARVAARLTG